MKSLIVILAICTLGYVVDHWQELTDRSALVSSPDTHRLIVYGNKEPATILLESDLHKRGIAFRKRDVDEAACADELTEKFARIGKMPGHPPLPVVEIDGALISKATISDVLRHTH